MTNNTGFDKEGSFELVLQVRDKKGNPTGKTRTFRTNSSERLATWFEQNTFRRKIKKRVDSKEQLSGAKAEEILADLYSVLDNDDEE